MRSVSVVTKASGRLRITWRSAAGPSTFDPSASTPAASIGAPSAPALRHWPTGLKFSSAKPTGSMMRWHDAHVGLLRCSSICCRTVFGAAGSLGALLERRHVGRRRRRRRVEERGQDELAAQHRRRAGRHRRQRQHAALPQQPAAIRDRSASPAGSASRRRPGCRSAWPAARPRTCSRPSAAPAHSCSGAGCGRRTAPFPCGSPCGCCRRNPGTAAGPA